MSEAAYGRPADVLPCPFGDDHPLRMVKDRVRCCIDGFSLQRERWNTRPDHCPSCCYLAPVRCSDHDGHEKDRERFAEKGEA